MGLRYLANGMSKTARMGSPSLDQNQCIDGEIEL
jgi:hypothetical protein